VSWYDDEKRRLVRVIEAYEDVRPLLDQGLAAWNGRSGYAPPESASNRYVEIRRRWIAETDPLQNTVRYLFGEEHPAWEGHQALERCFHYTSLSEGVDKLVVYGGGAPEVKRHTYDEIDSFFVRVRAALVEKSRSEPAGARKVVSGLGRLPDWIESHPQNIKLLVILVALILAVQFPQILAQLTDLIRAVQGR
jgi:hypothetical protein